MAETTDIYHMTYALALARRGLGRVWPNPSVGCVLVKGGHRIAAAHTADGGRPHAEALAIEKAGGQAAGAVAYVSLEPCAHRGQTGPCAQALIEAGVKKAFIACNDPDPRVAGRGIAMLKEAGITVDLGLLEEEAKALNAGFISRMTQKRPFVTLKTAISADGKIAAMPGQKTAITGDFANKYVHQIRAGHDAILVGIGTVLADNPQLTTRIPGYNHDLVRVVLDTDLKTPPDCRLIQNADAAPLIVLHNSKTGGGGHGDALEKAEVQLFKVDTRDIKAVLERLAEQGITRLLVEGGAKVHTSFLKAGFCDRFLRFKSPDTIGAGGLDVLGGMDIQDIAAISGLKLQETRTYGQDLLEIYE